MSPAGDDEDAPDVLAGRAQWISLLCEALPRALLAELGLARILLGSSGGGQFLLVLPGEARGPAQEFLSAAARDVDRLSNGRLQLLWGITENLGDWSVVRKRLNEVAAALARHAAGRRRARSVSALRRAGAAATPAAISRGRWDSRFAKPASSDGRPTRPRRFSRAADRKRRKHTWKLTPNLSRRRHHLRPPCRARVTTAGRRPDLATLARRAQGAPLWGVLRGDVDSFGVRLRRLHTIEEHVQLSVLYKQFFAGELEVLCSLPEFWKKVTILYSGGDDFAVYGAWDALLSLARELQRLFHRFTEENLKDFPGPEGKTISMGLALAPAAESTLAGGLRAGGTQSGSGQGGG